MLAVTRLVINLHHVSRAPWDFMPLFEIRKLFPFNRALSLGVSFHVGSGSADNFAYDRAIAQAKQAGTPPTHMYEPDGLVILYQTIFHTTAPLRSPRCLAINAGICAETT
jgi:hypothetical protein